MAIVLSWQGDVPSAVIVSEGQASAPESTAETVEPVPGASTGPEVLRPGLKETDVSPGLVGFLAIFCGGCGGDWVVSVVVPSDPPGNSLFWS